MARPLRVQFNGAWYHVMNRGADKRVIFIDDRLRSCFLCLLADLHETYGVETHAYCLMGNHYHLLLHTPRGNLARALRHLNGVYAQTLNRTSGGDGPIFRGRYHAVLIEEDEHLLVAARYIHRNPVLAGLVRTPEGYPWSSHAAYVGKRSAPAWLRMDIVLALIGGRDRRKRFQEFVTADWEDPDDNPLRSSLPVYGGDQFLDRIRALVSPQAEVPASKVLIRRPPIDVIVNATARCFQTTSEEILAACSRGRSPNIARDIALLMCRTLGEYPLSDIATAFRIGHYSAVSKGIRRARAWCREDPALARRTRRLRESLEREMSQFKT